jgi:hypothetical protein
MIDHPRLRESLYFEALRLLRRAVEDISSLFERYEAPAKLRDRAFRIAKYGLGADTEYGRSILEQLNAMNEI